MIVAGVMSGTSADGIDVALMRITGGINLRFQLLGHHHRGYSKAVRTAVLRHMDGSKVEVRDLARLNFVLGELYAQAISEAQREHDISELDLVGCHGQTLYHQGEASSFAGYKTACTWQSGEGSVIASRIGCAVVSDFRPADIAAGGQGAPLVPLFDYILYRHKSRGRILQNIGGIANLTAIRPKARLNDVLAFDCGPGNMVIDACVDKLFGKPFDRDGVIAQSGKALESVLAEMLQHPFFRQKAPKSAGREEFGHAFVEHFLKRCGRIAKQDVIATATALTAHSIAGAIRDQVLPYGKFSDYIVAGGGARNRTLMKMLHQQLQPLGLTFARSEDFGVPPQAKEAMAFAVLAYETWHRRPGNVPSATGARRPAVLGKISYA